jgi:hypothetical protein
MPSDLRNIGRSCYTLLSAMAAGGMLTLLSPHDPAPPTWFLILGALASSTVAFERIYRCERKAPSP